MPDKLDYKKEYKDLYLPKAKPMLVEVPSISFIMVDGKGAPEGEEYQNAVEALYALTFTIKMSKMGGMQPEGYFEYVVPPLEGLWYGDKERFETNRREEWLWTSMIRQPEFVTPELYEVVLLESREKKPELDFETVRFQRFDEGDCVQIMHIGPYADEGRSFDELAAFMEAECLARRPGWEQKHHEIYLSDPRRAKPERLKTVLRMPIAAV